MSAAEECKETNSASLIVLEKNFESWEVCKEVLRIYQNEIKQKFVRSNSKLLDTHPLPDANPACKYEFVRLVCKYGKDRHPAAETYQRETRTFKCGCEAFIFIRLRPNYKQLYIKKLNLEHTGHEGSEAFYEFLPENRRLSEENRQLVEKLLGLGCPQGRIIDHLRQTKGIKSIPKDIQNVKQQNKPPDKDDYKKFIASLKDDYDANVQVIIVEDHDSESGKSKRSCRGIYFSVAAMRGHFEVWFEVIYIDGTHKIFNNGLILYFLVVRDSHGFTHIVGVGLLVNEQESTIQGFIQCFISEHPDAIQKTKVIITDKDMQERRAILKLLPHIRLLLCEFHVLRAFSRQVCTGKLGITAAERDTALNLMNKLTKSKSVEEYDDLYEKLQENVSQKTLDYFDQNWHEIREEWTRYSMSYFNYGDYTNNPVESTNAIVKLEGKFPCSLLEFLDHFFRFYGRRNETLTYKLAESKFKRPRRGFTPGSDEYLFDRHLVHKAFQLVMKEYKGREKIDLEEIDKELKRCVVQQGFAGLGVSTLVCECNHHRSYQLPCRHIFALRQHFGMSLFDKALCGERWTKGYNDENHPLLNLGDATGRNAQPSDVVYTKVVGQKSMSLRDRRKRVNELLRRLGDLGPLRVGEVFENRCASLQAIADAWTNNEEVQIIPCSSKENKNPVESDDAENIRFPAPIKLVGRPSGIFSCNVQKQGKKKSNR